MTIKPRLEWKSYDGEEQVFPISASETTIGRKGDADIVISSAHVSRQHAKVVAKQEGHELIDMGSTHGTFVNREPITTRMLRHGDGITFGKHSVEFRFLIGESPQAVQTEDAARMVQHMEDLRRVLPSAASDLEKMLCVLDFQYQWNQLFTPETGLDQILGSALKISGAERAFIMTYKNGECGYAAGQDGHGRRLLESHFRTSKTIVQQVATTREPVFMIEGIDQNFAAQASIVSMNLRAIACMPLIGLPNDSNSIQILGILYLDSKKPMHSLTGLDQKILKKLAVEAGNVLEHVEMMKNAEQRKAMERDLALAEETQRNLLPRSIPKFEGLELLAFSRPTRYVGGDFYHFEKIGSSEVIGVLADISGKGVAASLLSSMLLGCLQLLLRKGRRPAEALHELNAFLLEKTSGKFATMFIFSVDGDGSGDFISAGHTPAYVYRAANAEVEALDSNCLIVGALDFATFDTRPLSLWPGDVLLVYSDGLTEAENPAGEMFGESRVREIVQREAAAGIDRLQQAILDAIQDFTRGQPQTDDITIVIMRRKS